MFSVVVYACYLHQLWNPHCVWNVCTSLQELERAFRFYDGCKSTGCVRCRLRSHRELQASLCEFKYSYTFYVYFAFFPALFHTCLLYFIQMSAGRIQTWSLPWITKNWAPTLLPPILVPQAHLALLELVHNIKYTSCWWINIVILSICYEIEIEFSFDAAQLANICSADKKKKNAGSKPVKRQPF